VPSFLLNLFQSISLLNTGLGFFINSMDYYVFIGFNLRVELMLLYKLMVNYCDRVIDIYAAKCKLCMKWRVIDTQEEFEEICHKIIQEPFDCSKKANCSCDDPADIEYDSSRTWAIYKPNIPKTPQGFKRTLVLRKDYSKFDSYYITPTGKRLRSCNDMAVYLKDHPQLSGVSASDFDFSSPKIMQDTVPTFIEQRKNFANKKAKIAKDEV
jgi:hypothetical protein